MWKTAITKEGHVYYFNTDTKKTQWIKPDDYIDDAPPIDSGYTLADRDKKLAEQKWNKRPSLTAATPRDSPSSFASNNTTSVAPPSKTPRIRGRKNVQKWREVTEPGGQIYYVNTQSGETSWEKPLEYVEFGREYGGIEIDVSLTFNEIISLINIKFDVKDDEISFKLESLLRAMQTCGSEEEWKKFIQEEDYSLPKFIYNLWVVGIDNFTSVLVAQLLALMGKVDGLVYNKCIFEWGILNDVFRISQAGLEESLDCNDDESLKIWMYLVLFILTDESVFRSSLTTSAPEIYVKLLLRVMSTACEDTADVACNLLCVINVFYLDPSSSFVLIACKDPDLSSPFSICLLRNINKQSYPYKDKLLLQCTLKCSIDLFHDSALANFFYTTDLKILVDILLREVQAFPEGDNDLRKEYLEMLYYIIKNSQWYSQGRHCRDEILTLLEMMLNNNVGGEECILVCEKILYDCADILE